MTPGALLAISIGGLIFAGMAAIGARTLHEFSRRDLENYCRARGRSELFSEIVSRHEETAVAAECLQTAASVVCLVSGGFWSAQHLSAGTTEQQLVTAILVGVLALLAMTTWIPWAVVNLFSAPFLYHTWNVWLAVEVVAWPLTVGVQVIDAVLRRVAGKEEDEEDEEEAFEEEIRAIVTSGMSEGLLEEDAGDMIEGVIELGDATVASVMTPRSRVDFLEIVQSREQMLRVIVESGRTRLPVCEGSLDNVIGILYVKDLLAELADVPQNGQPQPGILELLRTPWFVPATTPLDNLLREFLKTRSHMALVVDEYDGVSGVVTIEDVIEEIVGEIQDESDRDEDEPQEVVRVDDTAAIVLGQTQLDELNARLAIELPESDVYDTVGGFVISQLGYVPENGDTVHHGSLRLTVIEASPRKVGRIRLDGLPGSSP